MGERALNTELASAELCRRNGWGVGTRLVGDEGYGYGPTTIEITGIGEALIFAKEVAPKQRSEAAWTLCCREWVEVAHG